MSTVSNTFCDDALWDDHLTFNGSWPQFTQCFQDTILTLVPCGYLWLSAPFYTWYLLQCPVTSSGKTFSKLFSLKLIFLALVIIRWIGQLACTLASSPQFFRADVFSPLIQTMSLFFVFGFTVMEKRRHFVTSGILFVFWAFQILIIIIPFYSNIFLKTYDSDTASFAIFQVKTTFTLVMFVLQFFTERPVGSSTNRKVKPANPEPEASFPSRITFMWLNGFMIRGYKKPMTEASVFDLHSRDKSSTVVPRFWPYWTKAISSARERLKHKMKKANMIRLRDEPESIKMSVNFDDRDDNLYEIESPLEEKKKFQSLYYPSLTGTLFKTFWIELLPCYALRVATDLLGMCNPFLLGALVTFVENSSMQDWKGYVLAGALFLSTTFHSFFSEQATYLFNLISVRVRSSLASTIFRKALTMDNNTRKESSTGEIVNLMSVDVVCIGGAVRTLWALWTGPFQIIVCLFLLYSIIGYAVFAGLGFLLLMVLYNALVNKLQGKFHAKILALKDERMKIMNEMLTGIKIVKLHAWEPSFEKRILEVRNKELAVKKRKAMLDTVITFSWIVAPHVVMVLSFVTYIYVSEDHYLDPKTAFESIALFNIIRSAINFTPTIFISYTKAFISAKRISRFLFQDDLDELSVSRCDTAANPVTIRDGMFSWSPDTQPTLKNINVTVRDASLVAIIGPVGSGKSSLLAAILGEIKKISGDTVIRGTVSYVSQQAWIQNDTMKNNILFGKTYDEQLYKRCIEACALQPDLDILPAGDETEIGERGINLSGGQKQRVSLARAVYAQADICLLDDPLSAVDSHVGKHIFEHVISDSGMLAGKARVLVTHGIHWLPQTDHVIVMTNGQVSESGQFDSLLSHKGALAQLVSTFLLQHNDDSGLSSDQEYQDTKVNIFRQISGTADDAMVPRVGESKLRDEARISQREQTGDRKMEDSQTEEQSSQQDNSKLIEDEKIEVGSVRWTVIRTYAESVGYIYLLVIFLIFNVSITVGMLSIVCLSRWTDDQDLINFTKLPADSSERMDQNNIYIAAYAGFVLLQAAAIVVSAMMNHLRCIHVSRILHANMLTQVLHAPMSFFDTTPVGRILNRFSKDLAEVDEDLPSAFYSWMDCVMTVIGSLVIIAVNIPFFMLLLIPLAVMYLFVQRFFIATSRQLKRLLSKVRSPIINHFTETLMGTILIRAFGVQDQFIDQSEARVDAFHSINFASFCSNRWLGLRLQIMASLVVLMAATVAVTARDSLSPGLMGLVVIYALEITENLSWIVTDTSDMEKTVIAVERINNYSDIDSEAPWEMPICTTSSSWPEEGGLRLKGLSLRYRDGLDLVLKDLTLDILPAEKVGIVGRTGAGKSSLTVALFRLVEPSGGSILIDGVDITSLGLHRLRSKVTILPQDPVIFVGSLRQNLDPFGEHSDESLWQVLEHAHLKEFVESLQDRLGHQCGEGGDNISVGQRQLLCLGRALLRKTKVFILDEATAAIDMETDEMIQETIRKELKDCTILTIAHRLNTVMDYDRILVLDNGGVDAFDSPENLLKKTNGLFYSMAKTAGVIS